MTREAIPIQVVNSPTVKPGLTGNAQPLLHELLERVRSLLETGEASAIDLSALPLSPADLDWLREMLGPGEIAVSLNANGESSFIETSCSGVWWVTHRNEKGTVTSEFIEVAFVPELVKAHPQDVLIGCERLELLIADL